MTARAVSVIVVNYNSGGDLAECLTSLFRNDEDSVEEVLVVDNASSDGSAEIAREWAGRDRRVRLLPSATNLGYAGGVNFALGECRGRYLAVLNPDVAVESGCFGHLAAFLDRRPEAAGANPLLLLGGSDRINAAGQEVHVTGLGFNRLLGRPRQRAGAAPARVSGLQGGAMLLRRALLEEMGGWSELGFLYHEDVELSWLFGLMGHDLYCVPAAVARHKYHLTMEPKKFFLLERNRLAMLRTHTGAGFRLALSPLLALTELLIWAYSLRRGTSFLRAKASSYSWLRANRERLERRRAELRPLRRRSDWQMLGRLSWRYDWRQFLTLGLESADPPPRQSVAG